MKPASWVLLVWTGLVAGAVADSGLADAETQLREALLLRTSDDGRRFGAQDLDILYWSSTEYLLTPPSHQAALRALDAFIAGHGDEQIREPLRRAWLQRDLWQLFDWTFKSSHNDAHGERGELRARLALLIRRLALGEAEIAALPDNLSLLATTKGGTLFPSRLSDEGWVMVGLTGEGTTAPEHMFFFDAHSTFIVLLRLPGRRIATLDFIRRLGGRPPSQMNDVISGDPGPNFPSGTRWALVRTLNLIDSSGTIRSTSLVESVQMRTYRDPSRRLMPSTPVDESPSPQSFAEARVNRVRLPRLEILGQDDRIFVFVHFRSLGIDPFEAGRRNYIVGNSDPAGAEAPELRTCGQCHSGPGITSVLSLRPIFSEGAPLPSESTFAREFEATTSWKTGQSDWKELTRLWAEAR